LNNLRSAGTTGRELSCQANDNIKVDTSLDVGDVSTSVRVGEAGSLVEVRSSTIKETINRRMPVAFL
jgi:hypothetical protein